MDRVIRIKSYGKREKEENADIDDNVADAVLIGVFAAKTLRSD